MEFMNVICKRQSCRDFLSEQVSADALDNILKAANAAPVGMGKFDSICLTVIQNQELMNEINVNTARFFGKPNVNRFYNAPTVIVVSSVIPEGSMNTIAYANAACIMENILLAATEHNLGSLYIYGAIAALSQNPELVAKLGLPEGFVPISAAAIGKSRIELKQRSISMDKLKTTFIR